MSSFLLSLSFLLIATSAYSAQIEIATYNVENLFDAQHEEGKNDFEFLPKDDPRFIAWCNDGKKKNRWKKYSCSYPKDWSSRKLNLKIQRIASVFFQRQQEKGSLPDIIALTEIENLKVVKKLAKVMNFSGATATESDNSRGVDVGLIFQESPYLKYLFQRSYKAQTEHPSRKILEAVFMVNKTHRLFVYVNHWPAQFLPAKHRISVAKQLRSLIEKRQKQYPKAAFIATGDFNVNTNDKPHPFNHVLYKGDARLFDLHSTYLKERQKNKKLPKIRKGSYFYKKALQWYLLDRFLVSQNLLDKKGTEVRISDYEIYAHPKMLYDYTHKDYKTGKVLGKASQIPKRYNWQTLDREKLGYSDHLPVFMKLDL